MFDMTHRGIVVAFILMFNLFPDSISAQHGIGRWKVKTLADADTAKINFDSVGVRGIGPPTSRSQTERSTDELHPGRLYFKGRADKRQAHRAYVKI